MLAYESALTAARQHLYGRRPPFGCVWVLRDGARVDEGWYFWYNYEPIRFIRDPDGGPHFSGPPGFVVPDSGEEVYSVGWNFNRPNRPTW